MLCLVKKHKTWRVTKNLILGFDLTWYSMFNKRLIAKKITIL